MIKVFFIAKIKDLNADYKNRSTRLRKMAEQMPGFISIESEEIDDVEITVSSWRSKEDVQAWAQDLTHVEAKRKHKLWYHWVRGIHVECPDPE
tara:strand:- start:60 stop:338 length:279 start_codon:yes stop_codon:yes gene_type:complete